MRFARTALLLLGFMAQAHAAPRYALEALPAPPSPIHSLVGLNNAGQIAGSLHVAEFLWRGYLYTPGKPYAKLEPYGTNHGDYGMMPRALNERGEVAGTYRERAFVYRPDGTGGYVPQVPSWPSSYLTHLNDRGQAMGSSMAETPYLYTPFKGVQYLGRLSPQPLGTPLDLNNLGQVLYRNTDASGVTHLTLLDTDTRSLIPVAAVTAEMPHVLGARVNDSGLVAATVGFDSDHTNAMLYRAGNSFDLGRLTGATWSNVIALTEQGRVLGNAIVDNRQGIRSSVYLFIPGVGIVWPMANLDPATRVGWTHLELHAINDRGQIAGLGTFEGQRRAFVLNEVAP